MAIGEYKDIYTVDEYEERVKNIGETIAGLKDGQFFFQAKNRVKDQIAILRDKENEIFKMLHIEQTGEKGLDELNQRLQEYNKTVFNLSGEGLNQAFLEALRWENEKEYLAFERDVMNCINEVVSDQGASSIEDLGVKKAWQAVMDILRTNLQHFRSERGMTTTDFNVAKFTKAQKNRWKTILADRGYSGWSKNEKGIGQYDVEVDVNGDSIKNTFTWKEATQGLTPTEAEAKEKDSPGFIDDVNNKIRQLILNKTSDPDLIDQIITHVLSINRCAFFVGRNINDITGVLGEIQGLYYLARFLGGNLSEAIQWRGGTHEGNDGKKPHQDILLGKFGIQVKNTSKKEFFGNNIGFSNAGIETILDRIGISSEAKYLFYNFYATLNFNVEYHRDGRKALGAQYLPGIRMTDKGAKTFIRLHSQLEGYSDDIDKLLSLFAATLMYMDFYEGEQKVDANVLYLLGGTAFQTAANILSQVLRELEAQERSFNIKANLKNDKNIIAALNDEARGENYSTLVLNDIILTSSFRF